MVWNLQNSGLETNSVCVYVCEHGPFSTFIFYFVLAPENSARHEEKKSLQNLYDVKKHLEVAPGN